MVHSEVVLNNTEGEFIFMNQFQSIIPQFLMIKTKF